MTTLLVWREPQIGIKPVRGIDEQSGRASFVAGHQPTDIPALNPKVTGKAKPTMPLAQSTGSRRWARGRVAAQYDSASQPRRDPFGGLFRGHHREYLELDDVAPVCDPLIDQAAIRCLHDLKAALESLVDPTRNVLQTVRSEASSIPEAPIHRDRITLLEMLNDHVEHDVSCAYWSATLPVSASPGFGVWSLSKAARRDDWSAITSQYLRDTLSQGGNEFLFEPWIALEPQIVARAWVGQGHRVRPVLPPRLDSLGD